jgi:SAM-dependent methyltransferase
MNNKRIYGLKKEINSRSVKNFYNTRAKILDSHLHAIMLQPKSSDLPIQRNEFEKKVILDNILLEGNPKILDIGCGAGRIAAIMPNNLNYCGLDFAEEFIEIAQQTFQENENFSFHNVDIANFQNYEPIRGKKFNIVFIVGILIYLNDSIVQNLFTHLLNFFDKTQILQVYLRESISLLETRLTLDDFYSETLEDNYSAIYRTDQEYKGLLKIFESIGLYLSKELLFPEVLANNQETRQKLYILKRE